MIVEFASSLRWMEVFLEEKWGVKNRTARGYGIIIVCAKVQIHSEIQKLNLDFSGFI